jgi:hypothetical protein
VARTTNVTSFTVGGLRDGISYRFTVAAVNRAGTGPRSRESAAVTPRRPAPPSPPENVTAFAGYQSATVAWSAPASTGGAPVSRYTITTRPGHVVTTVPGDEGKAIVAGLTDGVRYALTVTATNTAGTSRTSAAARVTPAVTVPDPPSNVEVATTGSGAVKVQWSPPAGAGGSPLTGYVLSVSNGGPTSTVGPSVRSMTIDGLNPANSYSFSIAARNARGTSTPSASSAVTPDAKAAPAVVVLDAAALAALSRVRTDGALTFTDPPGQVSGLRPGDVIAAGVSKATPQGLLRMVDGVSSHGGTTTVTTSPAALNQAVTAGGLALGGTLGAGSVASFVPARPGIRLLRPAAADAGVSLGGSIGVSIDADLYKSTDDRTVHADAMISLTPAVDLSVSVSGGHIDASFQATVTEAGSVALKAQLSHEFSASIPLGEVTFGPIVFTIGPVPVVITPELSLSLDADGTITVGAQTTAGQSITYGVTLTSTDGRVSATPINQHTSFFSPPTLFDSLDLQIGPEAELSLLLYDAVGPYVKDELSLAKLHASTTEDPWWTLSAENVVSAGFKLSALGDDIADWSKSPLIDSTWPIANAGGPFMGVLISPDPASVAPGRSIQLSARVQRSPDQAVTWSVQRRGGTISRTGRYTAPAVAGYYPVTATSPASGLKPATAGIIVVRVGAQPPSAPTHVTAAPTGPGEATLSWTRPADTGGSPLHSYRVTSFPPGGVGIAGGNDTSTVVTGLSPGGTYQFALSAVNAAGPGPASAATAPITIPNVDPYVTSSWPADYGQLNGDPANPGETIISSTTTGSLRQTSTSKLLPDGQDQSPADQPPVVSDGYVYVPIGADLTVFNARTGALAYKVALPYNTQWGDIIVPGNGRAYLITNGAGAPANGAVVAVNLTTRRVAWVRTDKNCAYPHSGTFADGVLVTTGIDTCGSDGSTGKVLWNFSFPYPDITFGGITNGSLVYLTRQNATGDGQDFWLIGLNPATGAVKINRFFDEPGGGLMMAGGTLVLSTVVISGDPEPAVLGLDPATGLTEWTYTDGERPESATTDGSSIWLNECGKLVKLDAATGILFESVTSAAVPCSGPELAGDLIWMQEQGAKSGELSAEAVSASDLKKAASIRLPSDTFSNTDSLPVIADGHLFIVQQVGSAKWRLMAWGLP